MTPDERRLLVAVAVRVAGAVGSDGNCNLGKLAEMVEIAAPVPLTPRAKYVSIEHAPDPGKAAERWDLARKRADGITWLDPMRDEEKHRALIALGETPLHTAVAAILGASWAYLSCDGCDNSQLVRAVRIEGPYGDGHRYCETCIREAATILGAEQQ